MQRKSSEEQYPNVSIIVPAHNEEKKIDNCIESLLDQNYPKNKFEIIIVDNNSQDNTMLVVKKYPVKLLLENKKGPAAARNKGIKATSGEIIAFIDADCVADRDWLKKLVERFDILEICGVAGKIIAQNPTGVVERFLDKSDIYNMELRFKEGRPSIAAANAAFRRSILFEVGLFDETFITGEDFELAWRLNQKGYKIVYESQAIVSHKHETNLKSMFFQQFWYGYGNIKLYKKYSEKNHIRFGGYIQMIRAISELIIALLIIISMNKEKKILVSTPALKFVLNFAYKSGLIYGSIKYKSIYL